MPKPSVLILAQPHGASILASEEALVVAAESPAPPALRPPRNRARAPLPKKPWDRALALVGWAAGSILILGAAFSVAFGVYHYVRNSPRFALLHIELKGAERITLERLWTMGSVKLGTNLFQLDTQTIQEALLADPWVSEARVVRVLPRTLHVEVREREATAVASIAGQLYLVTSAGEPFKQWGSGDPGDLPVVTGVSPENLVHDKKPELERLRLALEVLREYQGLRISRNFPPQEIHLSDAGDVALTVGKSGVTLELGKGNFGKKLLMAVEVFAKLGDKAKTAAVVFLDNRAHPERVVVRLRGGL